ncbi:hypothetical protein [Paenibacillus ihumii]|uniref:hypothetical protein n=1 Tax=Paenibacillus ihumii TaxID=687436 RepID=UPI0006D79DAB|nr:hypothetical protein [Paenibacillus ihumii]
MAVTAKGGRYFYAWSTILPDGSLCLPDQALQEYNIKPNSKIILMTGRNTAKGFSVVCKDLIPNSPLAAIFSSLPELQNHTLPEGQTVTFKERMFCWALLNKDRYLKLPLGTWQQFGLEPGDQLLCLRATHLAFNILSEGPYIELAKQMRDIQIYE